MRRKCENEVRCHDCLAALHFAVINLSEISGVLKDQPSTTELTLFNRYIVSTKKMKDTVFVFFVGGYNVDGYALLDSDLKVKAISTWNYH